MKPWKSLAIASAVMAFTATTQAECLGVDHATQTVAHETATGTVTTNRKAFNRLPRTGWPRTGWLRTAWPRTGWLRTAWPRTSPATVRPRIS